MMPASKSSKKKSATAKSASGKAVSRKKTVARKTSAKKASTTKTAARKAPAKKPVSKKKSVAKKAPARKTAAKKTAAKKTSVKKTGVKKTAAKKAPAKKTVSKKKTAAKKTVAKKKPAASKAPAKKAAARKTVAKKSAAKKATAGKTPARKAAAAKSRSGKPVSKARVKKALALQPERPEPSFAFSGPLKSFKPYQPKPGEEYMSDRMLEHFSQILTAWKQELMEEVDRTVHHMKDEAANFPDPNDRATQESEFGLELRTRDRERKLLKKIEQALLRIEDGTYGFCSETGEEIGLRRLEARPVATLTVEAQERRELAEKQYRDRDER
jgi:DnaK suppressor protein